MGAPAIPALDLVLVKSATSRACCGRSTVPQESLPTPCARLRMVSHTHPLPPHRPQTSDLTPACSGGCVVGAPVVWSGECPPRDCGLLPPHLPARHPSAHCGRRPQHHVAHTPSAGGAARPTGHGPPGCSHGHIRHQRVPRQHGIQGTLCSACMTEARREGSHRRSREGVAVLEWHSLQQCGGGGPAGPVKDNPDRDSWPSLLFSHDERGVGHDGGAHGRFR